jgi:hypothetical protein
MVTYISWDNAKLRAREEPVIFAEVMSHGPQGQEIEIHVMRPTRHGLHEVERDDPGRMSGEDVDAAIARIAAAHGVRYAAIRGAEDHWPPDWSVSPR